MARQPYPPEGWIFARVANCFLWLAYYFARVSDVTAGLPVVGLISEWFAWVTSRCLDVKDFLLDADRKVFRAVDDVRDMLEGWSVNDIIMRIWPDWDFFRGDPVYYARCKVLDALGRSRVYAITWSAWQRQVLESLAPELQRFLDSPRSYVAWILDQILAGIGNFLADPVGSIINWLTQKAEWFASFIFFPWTTLVGLVRRQDPELAEWLTRPMSKLMERLSFALGLPPGFWNDPLRYFIVYLVGYVAEQFSRYRDTLYYECHKLLYKILTTEYW